MAGHRILSGPGKGTTTYENGTAPWETYPTGWDVAPNGEGGFQAVHHDWRDNLVPAGVGAIFAAGVPGFFPAAHPGAVGGLSGAGTNAPDAMDMAGAVTGGGGGGSNVAGSGGFLSRLGHWLSGSKDAYGRQSGGIDPMELLLGGASLLGNHGLHQQYKSYEGAGLADPKTALNHTLQSIYDMQNEMKAPVPVQQRTAYNDVAPVQVPGLGFQIGGALGHDPAMVGAASQDPTQPNVRQRTPQNG